MSQEIKTCQNCKSQFTIEPKDFAFYEKMKVPPPTWCPECRMIRRFSFYNQRRLFRVKDDESGKEIFSHVPPGAGIKIYDRDYWWSDGWDPMEYGKEYDFSRPFLLQLNELMEAVPFPSKNTINVVSSEYSNNADNLKNTYLCFDCSETENSAYVINGETVKEGFDLYSIRHGELCYEGYMIDEAFKVFFSVNCEECTDVWFSRNLYGCSNCFGCVNLRGKSYYIFNQPHSKEEYQKFILEFKSGSHQAMAKEKENAREIWRQFPIRFTLAIKTENSTGEHIEDSKNLKLCYSVHESENLAYCQFGWPPLSDSYDCTSIGIGASLLYEAASAGLEGSYNTRFSWDCWPAAVDVEYSMQCHSSSNLLGCVGLRNKHYCILIKQYSKEEYFALRERIISHMNEMPYKDKQGRIYKYGEFFPPEFSPFAYNETIAQDFFPLTKEEAEKRGFVWREPEQREYQITLKSAELPDDIKDVGDDILKEVIGCASCGRAYRVIKMELDFYRRIPLPLPRICPDCRFQERLKFVNPPKWRQAKCQCAGSEDDRKIYSNTTAHSPHAQDEHCPHEFETASAPEKSEIVYCEACYQSEIA